jgi:glutamine synthetase
MDMKNISWVHLCFVDVFGNSHSKAVPVAHFATAVDSGELFDGSAIEGEVRLFEHDMRLQPDTGTLADLGDGTARCACFVVTADGEPWGGDPRTALALTVEATEDLGAEFEIASELEFYLLDEDGKPLDDGGYFEEESGPGHVICRQAADRLMAIGVPIDAVHHEAGPSQYEIDIASLPVLSAADALVLAKRIVRGTAAEHGVKATFMPRPLDGEAGSGLHLHQRSGTTFGGQDGTLTPVGASFLAGQLSHARALSALAAPTVNSYKRLHSGPEAPSAVVWAFVNRGAVVRLSPNSPGGATIEFRAADPSANPYLLFAALLVTGASGVAQSLELEPAFEESVGSLYPASIDSVRVELLPRDIEEALDALESDDVLRDAFDPQLLQQLSDGRRAEAASYGSRVTLWEIERYLDNA